MKHCKLSILLLLLLISSCQQRSPEASSTAVEPAMASGSSQFDLTETEMKALEKEALSGNTVSARRLSAYFSFIKNDTVNSVRWLRIAANDRNPITIQNLAYDLHTLGGQSNCDESLKLLEQIRDHFPEPNGPEFIDRQIKELNDNFKHCVSSGRF